MKKYIATIASLLIATSASATCFNIVNGQGPDRLGNTQLAAAASKVCVQTNQYGETTIQLADSQGALAVAGVSQLASGRCAGYCRQAMLSQGNANGQYADFTGIKMVINVQQDSHLNIERGTLEITAGRDFPKTYLLQGTSQY